MIINNTTQVRIKLTAKNETAQGTINYTIVDWSSNGKSLVVKPILI